MSDQEYAGESQIAAVFSGFALPAPGLLTGITGGITFSRKAAAMRVTVALAVLGKLQVTVTDGATTKKLLVKDGADLPAGSLQEFVFGVRGTKDGTKAGAPLTYDFELLTNGAVDYLMVDEVVGAVI